MLINRDKEKTFEAYLKENFEYFPETGELLRKRTASTKAKIGMVAGHVSRTGYYRIGIHHSGKHFQFLAHRVAWFLYYGEWPKQFIDHINRDRLDNRIENLRDVCRVENRRNCDFFNGIHRGVCFDNLHRKWKSYSDIEKKRKNIGTFKTREEALDARIQYEKQFSNNKGEFYDK